MAHECKWCGAPEFGCGCICHNIMVKAHKQCSKDNPDPEPPVEYCGYPATECVLPLKGREVFLVCGNGAPLHAFASEADARDFICSKAGSFAALRATPSIVRMEVK